MTQQDEEYKITWITIISKKPKLIGKTKIKIWYQYRISPS